MGIELAACSLRNSETYHGNDPVGSWVTLEPSPRTPSPDGSGLELAQRGPSGDLEAEMEQSLSSIKLVARVPEGPTLLLNADSVSIRGLAIRYLASSGLAHTSCFTGPFQQLGFSNWPHFQLFLMPLMSCKNPFLCEISSPTTPTMVDLLL